MPCPQVLEGTAGTALGVDGDMDGHKTLDARAALPPDRRMTSETAAPPIATLDAPAPPATVSALDAARYCNRSKRTIHRAIHDGLCPSAHRDEIGDWRIPRADLDAFKLTVQSIKRGRPETVFCTPHADLEGSPLPE